MKQKSYNLKWANYAAQFKAFIFLVENYMGRAQIGKNALFKT